MNTEYTPEECRQIRRRRAAMPVYEWLSAMITSLMALVLLFTFCFRVVGVDGDSMVPTLTDKDRLVLYCLDDNYRSGDIVVIDRSTKEPLIKRVIAVSGDRIEITNDYRVYINGDLLKEPYIQGMTVRRDFKGTLTVPDGCLFVMGDNRSISLDSRSAEVGLINVKNVIGKALFRVWPLSKVGIYGNLTAQNENGEADGHAG